MSCMAVRGGSEFAAFACGAACGVLVVLLTVIAAAYLRAEVGSRPVTPPRPSL